MKYFISLFLWAIVSVASAQWQQKTPPLSTPWTHAVTPENAWKEYPRPQLQREEWMSLNGLWDFELQKINDPQPTKYTERILVPFCVESALSGVQKRVMESDRMWYKKSFSLPENWSNKDVLIHFDAVDWESAVWVNGAFVGAHKGGFDRFSFNITPYLQASGIQEIVVSVTDPSSDGAQARGKQQTTPQGIWYTPVSGIWQSVWLEAVSSDAYIREIKITPDIDQKNVTIVSLMNTPKIADYKISAKVMMGVDVVAEGEARADGSMVLEIRDPRLWSLSDPFLYDLQLTLTKPNGTLLDEIDSYFGMRKISMGDHNGGKYMFLNNEPVFQYGTLDQGWWPDGLHTPPSDEAMKWDIEKTKEMGFNTIRKHIKVENDRWYYHCDKLGMLVWQDMPSGMIVIPMKGKVKPAHVQHVRKEKPDLNWRTEEAAQYEYELRRMVDLHYNSPSIVMWVPFNEGWGQYATCRVADVVKGVDPTRLVNAVSGWSLRPCGDIYDIHTYQKNVQVPISEDIVPVIGEYGGIGYVVKDHIWDPNKKNWGYQKYDSVEEMLENYKLKFDQIVEMKKTKGLAAAIYTQTTDVEGEVNGLITYDRRVIKLSTEKLKEIHEVLYK